MHSIKIRQCRFARRTRREPKNDEIPGLPSEKKRSMGYTKCAFQPNYKWWSPWHTELLLDSTLMLFRHCYYCNHLGLLAYSSQSLWLSWATLGQSTQRCSTLMPNRPNKAEGLKDTPILGVSEPFCLTYLKDYFRMKMTIHLFIPWKTYPHRSFLFNLLLLPLNFPPLLPAQATPPMAFLPAGLLHELCREYRAKGSTKLPSLSILRFKSSNM